MTSKRRKYDKEFKIQAVKLLLDSGKMQQEICDELGIRHDLLSRWKKEYLKNHGNSFPGKGNQTPEVAEIARLKKENAHLKTERDILKKALAIFSKNQ